VDGTLRPYPSDAAQAELYQTVLGVAIDPRGWLWTLDHGNHGLGQPRLLAFDLATDTEVHRHDFTDEEAGAGSFLNDLQVSPDGRWIYIADVNVFGRAPALVIYDAQAGKAWRRLENHPSVQSQHLLIRHPDKDMMFFGGLFALRPAVDSIALDKAGQWLYYGAMTHETMYRVPAVALQDPAATDAAVAGLVEAYGDKPLSDGLSMDLEGNLYITDVEHRAVLMLPAGGGPLQTVIKDPRIRWADGLSFGPDGWLYVSDSAIPDIMVRSKSHIEEAAPYFLFRVRPGPLGVPGM
jgi:sugar lactone lactonase YvrE